MQNFELCNWITDLSLLYVCTRDRWQLTFFDSHLKSKMIVTKFTKFLLICTLFFLSFFFCFLFLQVKFIYLQPKWNESRNLFRQMNFGTRINWSRLILIFCLLSVSLIFWLHTFFIRSMCFYFFFFFLSL